MREADGTIERLLTGLRDAEPSAGLQRRILAAMEVRQAVAYDSRWRLRAVTALGFACALAFAVCLIGSLMVFVHIHQHSNLPAEVRSHSSSGHARQTTEATKKAPRASRLMVTRVPMKAPHTPRVNAATETQAASFPAPALPLTEQEKLLLQIARRRDAANMAVLNPEMRAAQSARTSEEFHQFFAMNASEIRRESE